MSIQQRQVIDGVDYVIDSGVEPDDYYTVSATAYELANPDHRVVIAWDIIPCDADSVTPETAEAVGVELARYLYDDVNLGEAYIIREL